MGLGGKGRGERWVSREGQRSTWWGVVRVLEARGWILGRW
jgi:hypothetical protein